MLLCLVGPQASGKDTIASVLAKNLGFVRVRVGGRSSNRASASDSKTEGEELHFRDADRFLDYATLHWQKDMVTTDLTEREDIEIFVKRPWFLTVAIEAGIIERWRRAVQRAELVQRAIPSLESFVASDDLAYYGPTPTQLGPKPDDGRPSRGPTHVNLPNGDLPSTTLLLPPSVDPQPSPPAPSSSLFAHPPSLTTRRSSEFVTTPIVGLHHANLSPLKDLVRMASYTLFNTSPSLVLLRTSLPKTVAHLRTLLRPSWDAYFMTLAGLASLRSNCMKRRVGAVLVTNREKRVLSTGYNGTPRGMTNCNEGGCARCNGTLSSSPSAPNGLNTLGDAASVVAKCGVDLNECLCLHAEENALLEAGRERAGQGAGSTLYCNTCPCLRCSVKIVQCGVREVCYALGYSMDAGTAAVFKEAGVELRQIQMPGS